MKTNQPLIFSIVIPLYNAEITIRESLKSALKQNFQHYEVIVVNDGSTDSSLKLVKENSDHRLRLFSFPKNMGRSNARNEGIRRATGDFIIFLDSDDYLDSNYLSAVSEILTPKSHHEKDILLVNYQKFNLFWKIKWSHSYPLDQFHLEDILSGSLFPISTMLFPRKFLLEHQLFFPQKLNTYEDWLFIIDCCLHGASLRYSGIKTKLTFIRIHGQNTMKKNLFMAEGLREVHRILKNKLEPKQFEIFHSAFLTNIGLLLGYSGIKSYRSEIKSKRLAFVLFSHYKYKMTSWIMM